MKLNKIIFFLCLFLLFLFCPTKLKAVCSGNYRCYTWVETGPTTGYCSDTSNEWSRGCAETGSTQATCGNNYLYPCPHNCYSMNCSWTVFTPTSTPVPSSTPVPCVPGSCKPSGLCYKPVGPGCVKTGWNGCSSCYVDCSVADAGCSDETCGASNCGQTVNAGGLVSGTCNCTTKTCPACCTSTNPEAPTLVSPANAAIYNVGSTINFDWNAIGLWGTGCPQSNKYNLCVSSNQSSCDNVSVATSATVTNYVWTASVGDSYVTWNVQSHNGSNGTLSVTRNFCVESVSCALQCGQTRNCSANCPSDDSGVPGVPVINYPAGTSSSPVILAPGVTGVALSLGGTTSLADLYYYGVYDDGASFTWASSTNTSVGITGLLPGNLYSWRARAVNDTCVPIVGGVGITSAASNYGYFRVNSPPVIGNFYIYNIGNSLVGAEAGSRNHICQSAFNGSRSVNFRLNVTDADGVNDINTVSLNWNGINYPLVKGSSSAIGATYSNTFDLSPIHDQNIYEIRARAIDFSGTTVDQGTGRNWKVWNCQVPVSGNMYDGSADHSCVGGFNSLADSAMGFNALIFSNSTESVTATVIIPDTFGPNNLFWSRSYLPYINGGNAFNPNGDLAATARMTRMIDLGTGTTSCPVNDQFNLDVSAYSLTPSAQIDFSFIRDQESWYQVRGGGIRAGDSIESGVPVTANVLERYLTLGKSLPTTINNGLVSYAINFSNINGYNDEAYGSPNSWWKNSSLLPATRYGYQYFYNNLYVKAGVGVTGRTWDEKPSEGVFFVNGNLTIDSNFSLPADRFFMVVVSGNITIANGVTQIDGIYVSDGGISTTGNLSNQALVINGMLYSRGSIRLARSFADKTLNNTSPATIVNYRPSLLFNMPIKISKVISGWRED